MGFNLAFKGLIARTESDGFLNTEALNLRDNFLHFISLFWTYNSRPTTQQNESLGKKNESLNLSLHRTFTVEQMMEMNHLVILGEF
jgi:hypothetical protein